MWQKRVGVTQYSDVTDSIFCSDHLFYFLNFISINHNSSCVLYHLFYILMSIKNFHYKWLHSQDLLFIFWPPKKKGHDVTGNRPGPWVSTRKLFICVRVWSSSHQFSRTPFNILTKHLPVFLGTPFSNLAEHLSLCLPWSTNKFCFFHLTVWLWKSGKGIV